MYTLAVQRDFIAQHFLIGGDWGSENSLHSHHYVVELQLEGDSLDEHNYLVDIVEVEASLEGLADYYRDRTLNELPEFQGDEGPINPSIEHFSRMFCLEMAGQIEAPNLTAVTVRMWENDIAWASYRLDISANDG
jgi:6-pyruvoyltetrahydropterin/6-carboxytetrahydropterin synthase